jgi:hypothetical protein
MTDLCDEAMKDEELQRVLSDEVIPVAPVSNKGIINKIKGFFVYKYFYFWCLWNRTPLKKYHFLVPSSMSPLEALKTGRFLMFPKIIDELAAGTPPNGETWTELVEKRRKDLMTIHINHITTCDGIISTGTIMAGVK